MPSLLTLQNPIRRRWRPQVFQDGLHLDFTQNGDAGFHYSKAIGAAPIVAPLSSFLTTTRAGTATRIGPTGLVESVAPNVARIDYDGAAGFLGVPHLLREAPVTNLDVQSETVGGAGWTNVRTAATANALVSPDGSATATLLTEDASPATTHFTRQDIAAVVNGTTYVQSVFAKRITRRYMFMYFGNDTASFANQGAWFDLLTGRAYLVAGFTTAPVAFGIKAYPGGWFRCWVSATAANVLIAVNRIALSDNGINPAYNGDGASSIGLWGWNFSPLPYLSSYVRSAAAPVTRAADFLSGPLGAWFLDGAGSVVHHGVQIDAAGVAGNNRHWYVGDGTENNRYHIAQLVGGSQARYSVQSGGANVATLDGGPFVPGAAFGCGVSWDVNSFQSAFNGANLLTDNAGALAIAPTTLNFDAVTLSITSFDYFPRAIVGNELLTRSLPQ